MGRKPVNLTEEIRFEVEDGGIAVITIDRPQARNAINAGVIEGLRLAWQRFAQDDALRVAILTGSGDKAFAPAWTSSRRRPPACAFRRATCSPSWATR